MLIETVTEEAIQKRTEVSGLKTKSTYKVFADDIKILDGKL